MITGTGLLTGFAGLALAALGLLVALLAGLRLLFLIRKPGKGRIARGIATGGLALILCGAALLAGEELGVLREATDRLIWPLSGIALLLATFAGIRAGRKRGRAEPPPPPAASSSDPAVPEQQRPPAGA